VSSRPLMSKVELPNLLMFFKELMGASSLVFLDTTLLEFRF
jgi:hypothetical protein